MTFAGFGADAQTAESRRNVGTGMFANQDNRGTAITARNLDYFCIILMQDYSHPCRQGGFHDAEKSTKL